ncbi:MAG: HAMP domain-containing histidine kinase [Alphaproteobacteria bacterium]|nr:HAMP domain-containing histidine kinase [Alphaproteobacteria bacterium]
MPYSDMTMQQAAQNTPDLQTSLSGKEGRELALNERIDQVFHATRQLAGGHFLLCLLLLPTLSSQVALSTKLLFIAASAIVGAAHFGLRHAFKMGWKGLPPLYFGWGAALLNFLAGLIWILPLGDAALSMQGWDRAAILLGLGLALFPSPLLLGAWQPAVLAFPASASLGACLVFAFHWTPQALGLMVLVWAGFGAALLLARHLAIPARGETTASKLVQSSLFQFAEANPVPSAVLRRQDGAIQFANSRLTTLLGLSQEDLSCRSLWDIVARREERQALLSQLHEESRIEDRETVLAPRPGRHLVTHLSLIPLAVGGEDLLMLSLRDVTQDSELRKAQVAARMAAESALATERRAVEEQRHFLAMVAHEFRTPLSIISTTMDILEMTPGTMRPETTTAFDRIRRATERLVRLIETCLNEDRLVDIGTLTREPCDLTQIMRSVVRDSRAGTNAARIEASLPDTPLTVIGDKALLKIAMANLIDNAEKYTKADGRIAARLTPYGDQAVVQVSDTGIGIPTAELPRIFDKYYRAPGAKGIAGAGLGLHLVKRIVELHGGHIEAASMQGQGSTFTVRLPIVPNPSEEPAQPES